MMPPESRKDRALDLIDQLRSDLENDDIRSASDQLEQLTSVMQDWQRSDTISAARTWLNDALQADLLSFDARTAEDYLAQWQDASENPDDNPELVQFQQQVTQRKQERQAALLIRGVIAHCEELLSQAKVLENSSEAPAPDFMIQHYYGKARAMVLAAQHDHEANSELEQLMQRVDRLFNHKETAASVFPIALEARKYSNALHNLDQLPDEMSVPRFTATEDGSGAIKLLYQGMVSKSAAREEIMRLAQAWATQKSRQAISTSQQHLAAHDPQQAMDELDLGENIEKFLNEEQKTALQQAQSEANTQFSNRQRAEEHAEEAQQIAKDDPQSAWDAYHSAVTLYQWADGLDEARQAVIKALRGQLKGIVREADSAFHERRDMERVQHLGQQARNRFADKDPSLTELLAQFDEFDDMVKRYQEYITNGEAIIEQVQSLLQTDVVAANDLLSQVESYPDFVLEAFNDLYDLRMRVNQRLNADHRYNQLYPTLYNESASTVSSVIEQTQVAAGEFPDDARFQQLTQWLQYHMAYLTAQQQAEAGAIEQALQWLAPVVNTPQHPDYENAQALYQRLQDQAQQAESDE